jgi:hypothetical protein
MQQKFGKILIDFFLPIVYDKIAKYGIPKRFDPLRFGVFDKSQINLYERG